MLMYVVKVCKNNKVFTIRMHLVFSKTNSVATDYNNPPKPFSTEIWRSVHYMINWSQVQPQTYNFIRVRLSLR